MYMYLRVQGWQQQGGRGFHDPLTFLGSKEFVKFVGGSFLGQALIKYKTNREMVGKISPNMKFTPPTHPTSSVLLSPWERLGYTWLLHFC